MFRNTEDTSSGSFAQCLAKNYKNGYIVSVDMDVVGVMAAYSDPLCTTCWSTFKYFIILILFTYCILCISWIITCLVISNLLPPEFYFLSFTDCISISSG